MDDGVCAILRLRVISIFQQQLHHRKETLLNVWDRLVCLRPSKLVNYLNIMRNICYIEHYYIKEDKIFLFKTFWRKKKYIYIKFIYLFLQSTALIS